MTVLIYCYLTTHFVGKFIYRGRQMNEYGEMVETYRQEKNPKYSDRNKTYSIVSLSLSLSLLQFIYELAWSETRTSPVRGRRLID